MSPPPERWRGRARGLAWWLVLAVGAPCAAAQDVFVSAAGDDASGDGSPQAPFRTITRALRGLDGEAGPATIRLAMGTYDAAAGEAFPLRLPMGTRLQGHGSQLCHVEGAAGTVLVTPGPGVGRVVLDGLLLRGAGRGVLFEAPAEGDRVLQLGDVAFERLEVGVEVRLGRRGDAGVLHLRADGARFRDCGRGVEWRGESPLAIDLHECTFSGGQVGLAIDGATEAGEGVHHALRARGCRFEGMAVAAVQRTGADGVNRAPEGYVFEDCVFRGNRIGIDLDRPAGDSPLSVRRCTFLENELFGVHCAGQDGDPALTSRVEDSTFRWNGVAFHVVNTRVRYEVRRNRILDTLGNGVFYASFDAATGRALFESNLVARSGAAGFFLLADAHRLEVDLVHNTVADNAGSGVERFHRHGGASAFAIAGCIVAGNGRDLVRVEPGEVRDSLVGDGSVEGATIWRGDPGFVDAAARDYRLADGSPCLDAGTADGTALVGPTDLAGQARHGPPDLGAYEK